MSETPAEAPAEEPKAEEVQAEKVEAVAPAEPREQADGAETRIPLTARITPAPEPLTSTDDGEASQSAPVIEPFADAPEQKDEVGEPAPVNDSESEAEQVDQGKPEVPELKADQNYVAEGEDPKEKLSSNLAPKDPYVENEDHRPNPTDLYGFYDTSGAGTREDPSKAYPDLGRLSVQQTKDNRRLV
jgi:hypothetical protein